MIQKIIRSVLMCVVALSIVFQGNRVFCQSHQYNNDPFYKLPERIKHLKRGSISIEGFNNGVFNLYGSGFLIHEGDSIYGVTNFHVIRNIPANTELIAGITHQGSKLYVKATVHMVDEKRDIALLQLSSNQYTTLRSTKSQSLPLANYATIGSSLAYSNSEILEGIGILTIGYPLSLGQGLTGNQPLVRIGIVARSPDSMGFFYIDGISSHGNSGSPVFNAQSNELMGMVIGFPPDFIDVYDEQGQMVAKLPYNSGLSICISAEEIFKLLD